MSVKNDEHKLILDACCGSKMLWYDKNNPNVLYVDKRQETVVARDRTLKRVIEINPDLVCDFTNLPFDDNSFYHVVFDPPHIKKLGKNSWMAKKYGRLPEDWEFMIKKGFNEYMRVLKVNGTLVFKWSEVDIKTSKILSLIQHQPLYGHRTTKKNATIWMCFMKIKNNT